ncbi:MAG: hypothetical protein WD825_04820 [Gemmatimonadaceae bacterium]
MRIAEFSGVTRLAARFRTLSLEIMVSRRSRSVFAALAFALLPIVSMVAGGSESRAQAALAWMQWQAKAPSPAQGVGATLAELAKHHADVMPFAPVEVFDLALSTPLAVGTASVASIASATAPATLHPARAPPALS